MEQNPSGIYRERTWDNGGVTYREIHIRVRNTDSASDSKLVDLQVDDVTKFSVDEDGNIVGAGYTAAGNVTAKNGTTATELTAYATYSSATSYHRAGLKSAKVTKSAVSGATVTCTGLIPAGAFLIGVTTRVNTALGAGGGTTGYTVGDGSDADLWGAAAAVAAGTQTKSSDFTAAGAAKLYTAAQDVVLTAVGGNFNGTGAIEVVAHYLITEAD